MLFYEIFLIILAGNKLGAHMQTGKNYAFIFMDLHKHTNTHTHTQAHARTHALTDKQKGVD